ncbi:MAG: formate dehydrogenase accessory sulfurtransferase FdhD [Proteobacteria bacterium]|nr:formate dehydrogenase accessory sulfurtransferase FdhD [Pseudomonadota bacterium]MBU4471368.1 formate dehydrogenase accessory sulfurtransferase FdhD [Pseudomonadota bacterium]
MLHRSLGIKTQWSGDLIGEEPLAIRIQGNPYSVVMRTPGNEKAHAAGFCLGEGIVETPEDITSLALCDGPDSHVVTVTLTEKRRQEIPRIMDRRGFISQTSCGICGKELIEDLVQEIHPVNKTISLTVDQALHLLENLNHHQPLGRKTRACHAAALFDPDLNLLAVAEDVGRHNALDKAIGELFLDRRLSEASILVLSSRISYELVQKAARARIPVILAVSRPTSLAVSLSEKLNMTLACLSKSSGLDIFCNTHRIL